MAEPLRDEGDLSTREIGAALGVSQTTASRDLSQRDSDSANSGVPSTNEQDHRVNVTQTGDDETAAINPDDLPVASDPEAGEITRPEPIPKIMSIGEWAEEEAAKDAYRAETAAAVARGPINETRYGKALVLSSPALT